MALTLSEKQLMVLRSDASSVFGTMCRLLLPFTVMPSTVIPYVVSQEGSYR